MLQIALRFHDKGRYASQPDPMRRQPKVAGYQLIKPNYHILKLLVGEQVNDIPRARIVEYHYITVADTVCQQGNYFILPANDSQLPSLEAITKTELKPSVYLWRDDQWWSFPQLETYTDGEMIAYTITTTEYGSLLNPDPQPQKQVETRQIEKTKIRVRQTYEPSKGPGFLLAPSAHSLNNSPTDFPSSITGNGMVLEWKRGYADKPPCWWIRDERRVSKAQSATYRHYAILKATPHALWSKGFSAWYYTGGALPPQKWLELVGYTPMMSPQLTEAIATVLAQDQAYPTPASAPIISPAEQYRQLLEARRQAYQAELEQRRALATAMQPYHQFQAMLTLSQRFAERLHHLNQLKALPALATPPLDDPWS